MKRSTWARARSEDRVPIRRVRCPAEVEVEVEVEVEGGGAEFAEGWVTITGYQIYSTPVIMEERG
jgi:hypothetical protein